MILLGLDFESFPFCGGGWDGSSLIYDWSFLFQPDEILLVEMVSSFIVFVYFTYFANEINRSNNSHRSDDSHNYSWPNLRCLDSHSQSWEEKYYG